MYRQFRRGFAAGVVGLSWGVSWSSTIPPGLILIDIAGLITLCDEIDPRPGRFGLLCVATGAVASGLNLVWPEFRTCLARFDRIGLKVQADFVEILLDRTFDVIDRSIGMLAECGSCLMGGFGIDLQCDLVVIHQTSDRHE